MLRRFELHRDRDISGVSGTGVIAEGVQFDDQMVIAFPDNVLEVLPPGWCRIVWLTEYSSTVLWRSVDEAMHVHGHGGATRLVWVDS